MHSPGDFFAIARHADSHRPASPTAFVHGLEETTRSVLTDLILVAGGKVQGLNLPKRVFACATPAEVRSTLPEGVDVLAFQCRNPIHKAHYELFIRALDAPNVSEGAVCLVHPTCGPTQVPPYICKTPSHHASPCMQLLIATG